MFALYMLAIVCLILAFVCGISATTYAENTSDATPSYEFVSKQLTAGAWVFAAITVAALSVEAIRSIYSADRTIPEAMQDLNEVQLKGTTNE